MIQPSIGSGPVYSFPEKQPCPDHVHMCSADQHLGDAGSWTAPPVGLQTRGRGVVYDANAFSPGARKEFLRAGPHSMTGQAKKVGGVSGVSRVRDSVRCASGRYVQDPRCSPLKTLVWFSSI